MDLPPVPCKVRLWSVVLVRDNQVNGQTYVTTGEVTTLKHKVGNDTVELGARVAETLLAGAESAEVLDSLGDYIVEELKVDAARALFERRKVSLMQIKMDRHGHVRDGRVESSKQAQTSSEVTHP